MPCTYYSPGEEREEIRKVLNKATKAACEALRFIEEEGRLDQMSLETRRWWTAHKKRDKERREAEANSQIYIEAKVRSTLRQKSQALSKLTVANQKLLGLYRAPTRKRK